MTGDPKRWGKPASALLGALEAQLGLGLPAIGGKDSMSGTFETLDVPPTLVSFAVTMTKASKTRSASFAKGGSKVYLLPIPENKDTLLPDWEKVKEYYGTVLSPHGERRDWRCLCGEGGRRGRRRCADVLRQQARLCICRSGCTDAVCAAFRFPRRRGGRRTAGEPWSRPSRRDEGGAFRLDRRGGAFDRRAAFLWMNPLEKVFPNNAPEVAVERDVPLFTERNAKAPAIKAAKPRVFIPVFPGTNCEYDTARAFEKAGAETEILVVRNLSAAAIEETIAKMEQAVRSAQIVMLPGGFSGGDEPDGSGKFIATTFRSPRVADAVAELLEKRDGLMLGICNGFQALIKLGLVPYGRITEPSEAAPTLTFNTLGRHVSRMAYTRVTSVKSPWFAGVNAGDIFAVPVSHGEGRFVASGEVLDSLIANGQIATQYVTPAGSRAARLSGIRMVRSAPSRVSRAGRPRPRQDGPLREKGRQSLRERSRREGSASV